MLEREHGEEGMDGSGGFWMGLRVASPDVSGAGLCGHLQRLTASAQNARKGAGATCTGSHHADAHADALHTA